jgi:hypothetical protein
MFPGCVITPSAASTTGLKSTVAAQFTSVSTFNLFNGFERGERGLGLAFDNTTMKIIYKIPRWRDELLIACHFSTKRLSKVTVTLLRLPT